jgi:hypothetical protein
MVTLILALIPVLPALAADVSAALYKTTLTVSNNSTSDKTAVSGVFTLSTADMITLDMLSANASDAAILYSGASLPFMPSINATYPWCVWVPVSDKTSSLNYYLYTKFASGGDIVYFPGDDGMSVADAAGLELGNDGSVYMEAYLKETGNIFSKGMAVYATYNSTSDNVTVYAPHNRTSYETGRNNTIGAYGVYWTGQSTANITGAHLISSVSIHCYRQNNPGNVTIYLYESSGTNGKPTGAALASTTFAGANLTDDTNGAWYNASFATPYSSAATKSYFIMIAAPTGDATHRVLWSLDNTAPTYAGGSLHYSPNSGTAWTTYTDRDCYFQIWSDMPILTATNVTEGEYGIAVSINTTHIKLLIDGVEAATVISATGIPDTTDNWTFNGFYIREMSITKAGALAGQWKWNYGETFTDMTGGGHTGYPTFRSASSDSDVVITIDSQEVTDIIAPVTPPLAPTGGWQMIGALPATPGELFTEGGTTFPGAAEINTLATDLRLPYEAFVIPLAFFTAGLAGAASFAVTHKLKTGTRGSFLLFSIVTETVLMIWVFAGGGVIPGWVLIPFGLFAVLLLLIRNPYSPVT